MVHPSDAEPNYGHVMPVALHVSPHPDDELLGAGATLFALRDAGWHVVNLGASIGRPAQHERRRAELEEACRRARFTCRIVEPPLAMSSKDDLVTAEARLVNAVDTATREFQPDLIVSPSPHDVHHGHELVGRATRESVKKSQVRWWMWGFWASLPFPTLYTPFDHARLQELQQALDAHKGENERSDWNRVLESRARATASMGIEQVFDFGAEGGSRMQFGEVITDVGFEHGRWRLGNPHVFDAESPLAPLGDRDPGFWAEGVSVRRQLANGSGELTL